MSSSQNERTLGEGEGCSKANNSKQQGGEFKTHES